MGYFLQELKRRNVFRVGAAYVVVSWLILQVIETVSDPLGLPEWTEAFFIVLLVAGLPIVTIFAWAFEITPEGLKKTKEVDQDESVTADTGKKLNYAIIVVLVLALGYFVWERQGMVQAPSQTVVDAGDVSTRSGVQAASIAVLPFVNMSADPEQEYFSDGISEELLNLLAKIPDLRVPARTSSFQFKGQNLDIAEVAEQLNVAHVLEGSVRKADVRIRVTAQLIEAESGYHLWSDTYDRELTDIFAIQDEISAAIVEALSDTLGLTAESLPQVTQSANPEAYNHYLLGQHLINKRTKGDIEASIPSFEKAIELDPEFAPAHAGLGLAWRLLLRDRQSYGTLTLEEMLARAEPPIERALELEPNNSDALGAKGLLLEASLRHEEALPFYEQALDINPSQTDIRNWYSMALSELGRETEASAEMAKAYELDPLSLLTLNNYANDLHIHRRYEDVGPVIERLKLLDPARAANIESVVLDEQHRKADAAITLFRGVDQSPGNLREQGAAAFALLEFGLVEDALQVWPYPDILPIISNTDDAEYTLELARARFENDPSDPGNIAALAWAYWGADDYQQALRNGQRFLDTLEASRRSESFMNWMFMIEAWQRDDQAEMMEFLEPLEANIEKRLAAGVDLSFLQLGRASINFLKDDIDKSLAALDLVLSRSGAQVWNLRDTARQLGWYERPAYASRLAEFETYLDAEKTKFLKVACGPDGFSSWQPSPETCSRIKSI